MAAIRLFKVGADPEFSFLDADEEIANACDVMTRVTSKFGLDGCESIAELRPSPSINPSQVVQNLCSDMLRGYYANPDIKELYWKAGSITDDCATGGHIHLGIHQAINRTTFGSRRDYYKELTKYMDTYLAQVVRLLDDPTELKSRLDNEYGYLGDYRENSHGMEYRVLGSWLTSPRVAEGVLCLAQAIAYQHMWLTANKKMPTLDQLAPAPETNEFEEFEGSENITKELKLYRSKFSQLRTDIRKFKLYRQHELPIEFIFKLVEKKKSWYPGKNVDMKQAWGITTIPTIGVLQKYKEPLPAVKLEDIWKRARN